MNIHEKTIIGGILSGAVKASIVTLDGADFEDNELGRALTIAKEVEAQGLTVDADILHRRLVESDLGFFSPRDFQLMAQSAQSATVVFEAIGKVKSSALKTFLIQSASNLALQENRSGADILDKLKDIVNQADKFYRSSENNFVFLKDLMPEIKGLYADLYQGISYAVPTYFTGVDSEILDGFSKGDLHVLVGFTGQGKSALALNFARNQAQHKHVVGFVSREMSSSENVMRLQSADTEIPRWKIRKEMFEQTYTALNYHLDAFADLPIAIDTRTSDIESLRIQVRQMVEKYNLEILYVDYLQLMKSSANETRAQEVSTVSRGLKEIAMENKIPVVALCQFNRGAVNASLFDILNYLKESSGIEQDASTILYVQVEKTEERKDVKDAKLTVIKNRNGATFANVPLTFRGEIFQFFEA